MNRQQNNPTGASVPDSAHVSRLQRHLLRAMYLLIVVGLGITLWPQILWHHSEWKLMDGVTTCMLGAFSILCVIGLRYPLRMLPVLLWELVWKCMWLGIVAWPMWTSDRMTPDYLGVAQACLFVALIPLVLPWRYVFRHYLSPRTALPA